MLNAVLNAVGQRSERFRSLRKTLSVAGHSVQLFRNWPAVIRAGNIGPGVDLEMRNGIKFRVARKDTTIPVITEVWRRKAYGDLEYLKNTPSPVVIDLGAHIGSFSVFVLSKFPGARVYSYEPDPKSFECISHNIRVNNFGSRAVAVNKAVMGDRTPRAFYIRSTNSPSNSLFLPPTALLDVSKIMVACVTLSDVLDEHKIQSCDLMKMDCQGGECSILFNTPTEYLARIKRIVLEFHNNVPGCGRNQILTFLKEHGYATKVIPENRLIFAER